MMEQDISHVACATCGERKLRFEKKLIALPLGSHSLSGNQMKVSARYMDILCCDGCKHWGECTVTQREDGAWDVEIAGWHATEESNPV